jgi:hypothetical protein
LSPQVRRYAPWRSAPQAPETDPLSAIVFVDYWVTIAVWRVS